MSSFIFREGDYPLIMHHHCRYCYCYHCLTWQNKLTCVFVLLPIWICVMLSVRYGFYGDCHMVLEPNSSRLVKASSLFVKQVEVRDDGKNRVFLYGFSEKPELSVENKWKSSKLVIVESYSHKGISLWLNKGSRIRITCEVQSIILNKLEMSLIKGEQKHEKLHSTNSYRLDVSKGTTYGIEAAYKIEEDDKYNVGIINSNPKDIILLMNISISSTTYDITKAKIMCSTKNGPCRLNLSYPSPQYVVLRIADTQEGLSGTHVEISFIAHLVTYLEILGIAVIIICLVLKSLGACHDESYAEERTEILTVSREVTETNLILPQKEVRSTYGTYEEEANYSRSSSSEDLYDGRICVICYDNPRNCFFIPCGHFATCQECAQRIIMNVENKVCPVCRRPIHKVRKLIIS